MIVDTSVMIALLVDEVEVPDLLAAMRTASSRRLSAGNHVELSTVIARRFGPAMFNRCDEYLRVLAIEVAPVTLEQTRIGRTAYRRYGKGSGSRAKLNYGDCFAYALAIETGEPLLFKGEDFVHTDVKQALPR